MLNNDVRIQGNNSINDAAGKQKAKNEQLLPIDVLSPERVNKPAKQDGSGSMQNSLNANADSVFNKFLQALKELPELAESGKKLILNRQFINQNIKSDPILNTLFEGFMESIKMSEGEILELIKFQQNTYTKYHGKFFDTLRTLLKGNPSNDDFKLILRNFLKSYECFVSVNESYSSIMSNLKSIRDTLPQLLKEPFDSMTDKFVYDGTDSHESNLNLLKNEIIPFMGRYIAKMNDFGVVRDYVSVLIHNIVRLEAGSQESFSNDLDMLFDFLRYNLNIGEDKLNEIKLLLVSTHEEAAALKNKSMDSFLKLIEAGIKKSENPVNREFCEDIAQSLLFSHNVQMPLMHMFFPVNYNGMFMFSELWVGKGYEKPEGKKNQELSEFYKVYITFDIHGTGYFEAILIYRDSKVSLEISVPNSLSAFSGKIKNDIGKILSSKKVPVTDIYVNECIKKRKFNEVFSNLSERKVGVNVIV